jgi:hypothetical protein
MNDHNELVEKFIASFAVVAETLDADEILDPIARQLATGALRRVPIPALEPDQGLCKAARALSSALMSTSKTLSASDMEAGTKSIKRGNTGIECKELSRGAGDETLSRQRD